MYRSGQIQAQTEKGGEMLQGVLNEAYGDRDGSGMQCKSNQIKRLSKPHLATSHRPKLSDTKWLKFLSRLPPILFNTDHSGHQLASNLLLLNAPAAPAIRMHACLLSTARLQLISVLFSKAARPRVSWLRSSQDGQSFGEAGLHVIFMYLGFVTRCWCRACTATCR